MALTDSTNLQPSCPCLLCWLSADWLLLYFKKSRHFLRWVVEGMWHWEEVEDCKYRRLLLLEFDSDSLCL